MALRTTGSFAEKWLWESEPLKILVGGWTLFWVLLGLATYPFWGVKSFHALWGVSAGPLFWIGYRIIGRKVEVLSSRESERGLEAIQCLMVNGLLQCPGIVVLERDALILEGVIGKRITVEWPDITAFREVRWFNGSRLFFKTGFWLTVRGRDRLGVAVPDSSAALLRNHLSQESSPGGSN